MVEVADRSEAMRHLIAANANGRITQAIENAIQFIDAFRQRRSGDARKQAQGALESLKKIVQESGSPNWGARVDDIAEKYGHLDMYGPYGADHIEAGTRAFTQSPETALTFLRQLQDRWKSASNQAQGVLQDIHPLGPITPIFAPGRPNSLRLVFTGRSGIRDLKDLMNASKRWHDIVHPITAADGKTIEDAKVVRVGHGSVELVISLPESSLLLALALYNLSLSTIHRHLEVLKLLADLRNLKKAPKAAVDALAEEAEQAKGDTDGYYGNLVEKELAELLGKSANSEHKAGLGRSVREMRAFQENDGIIEIRLPVTAETKTLVLATGNLEQTVLRLQRMAQEQKLLEEGKAGPDE